MKALIGIDAGHGGSSSGTHTCNTVNDGLFEKDFALEQALMIEKKLLANGFRVVLTRRTDTNPGTVIERADIMSEKNVDFAVSIHFNGFDSVSAGGCEVYIPYKEKTAKVESGFYRGLTKYFKERKPFARSNNFYNRSEVFDKKLDAEKKIFAATADKKDYFGFIRGCWGKGISADLLEICFLTNPEDFEKYQKNKEKIADDIAKSIVEGFGEKYISSPAGKLYAVPRISGKDWNSRFRNDVIN